MLTRSLHLQLFLRSFFLQVGWNFAKYQNLGLCFVMLPFLKKTYMHDPELLPSALERYLENFNTQPFMASFCFGALASQEEKLASAKNLAVYQERASEWNSIKRSLSITTASIGDRLFWGTLKPLTLLLALCVWLGLGIDFFEIGFTHTVEIKIILAGMGLAFGLFNLVSLLVRWRGISLSYHAKNNGCFGLTQFDWNKSIYYAKCLGMVLSLALLLWGIYYFLYHIEHFLFLQFITRSIIVLFFVGISLITRGLRIPNMYVYMAAMLMFSLVCFF